MTTFRSPKHPARPSLPLMAATTAAEAAALVSQLTSAVEQLIAGVDLNGDGRITWDQGEGGLQHAEEHVKLMLGLPS